MTALGHRIIVVSICLAAASIMPVQVLADAPQPPRYVREKSAVFVEDGYIGFLFKPTSAPAVYPDHDSRSRSYVADFKTAQDVPYYSPEPAGTIVIEANSHSLYLVQGNGRAIRYVVGVGREGHSWRGVETISKKAEWPAWIPPEDLRQRRPDLPRRVSGGPDNPLGARALYLGDTLYRIHGTNEPETVGTDVSAGCFRLTNADVVDLYERVAVGAKVVVR